MMLSRQDLPLIRGTLLLLAAVVALGAAAVWGSGHFEKRMQDRLQETQNTLSATRNQFQQVRQEQEDIRRYQARYQELVAMGLIGEEKRLEWMESIARIRRERKLFEISYEIAPQQPIATDPSLPTGDFQLLGSRITVRFGLLHEGDLVNFLEDLGKQGTGLYVVQQCLISRAAAAPPEALQPSLDAACTLTWLTLKKPN